MHCQDSMRFSSVKHGMLSSPGKYLHLGPQVLLFLQAKTKEELSKAQMSSSRCVLTKKCPPLGWEGRNIH